MTNRPIWEIVEEAARSLSLRGDGTFRLGDIIEYVQFADPARARTSIQPIVQGMTVNAGKGPPSPCGKILRRVYHGLYVLDGTAMRATSPPVPRQRTVHGRAPDPVPERIAELKARFGYYVRAYDASAPFRRAGQLEFHQSTIRIRRRLGSVRASIEDPAFVDALRSTLYAWGIGKRGRTLASAERLSETLRDHLRLLEELEPLALEAMSADDADAVIDPLFALIGGLDIVDADARIVAGSKTLHHLLPDLVPPMDRAWTGAFFNWSTIDAQYRQVRTFTRTFSAMADVAQAAKPSQFEGGGWRTSSTKVLDNAVVGYCLAYGLGGGNKPSDP